MRLAEAKHAIRETAGFYDTFQVQDILPWVNAHTKRDVQVIRETIRELVKEGLLVQVERGTYEWR